MGARLAVTNLSTTNLSTLAHIRGRSRPRCRVRTRRALSRPAAAGARARDGRGGRAAQRRFAPNFWTNLLLGEAIDRADLQHDVDHGGVGAGRGAGRARASARGGRGRDRYVGKDFNVSQL